MRCGSRSTARSRRAEFAAGAGPQSENQAAVPLRISVKCRSRGLAGHRARPKRAPRLRSARAGLPFVPVNFNEKGLTVPASPIAPTNSNDQSRALSPPARQHFDGAVIEGLKPVAQSSATVYTVGIFDEEDPDRNPEVLLRLARSTGGESFFPGRVDEVVAICARTIARASGQGELSVRSRSSHMAGGAEGAT
jgi:hypothetical protein